MNIKQMDDNTLRQALQTLSDIVSYKSTMGIFDIFKNLKSVVYDDEEPVFVNAGLVKSNIWLIIPTNKRLIFLNKAPGFFNRKIVSSSLDYKNIISIDHSSGLAGGKISFNTSSKNYELSKLQKNTVAKTVELILSLKNTIENNNVRSSNSLDIASQLEKLANLYDKGLISREEFDSQKDKLLN